MAFSVVRRPCVALLLPDSGKNSNEKPSRLIIPGQNRGRAAAPPSLVTLSEPDEAVAKRTFRPPMGYFAKSEELEAGPDLEAEVMIQRLRAGIGRWHELAAFLPRLAATGYDSQLLEEMTGVPKREQTILVTAASVLQSLVLHCKENGIPQTEETFSFFDIEGAHFALHELRFLDVAERMSCAGYVAQHQLSAKETQDLARATKEYHRRGAEETGFQSTPEDILAYQYYRNALESREERLIASFVERGLQVVQSNQAREKLEAVLSGHEKIAETKDSSVTAKIHIYRLLSQEILFRPLPYAGALPEVEASALQKCPSAKAFGEFGIFAPNMDGTDLTYPWKWLTLPNWPLFAHAKQPVALSIQNCASVPELRSSVKAKNRDEALRLSGSGMLIADVSVKEATEADAYYLVKDVDSGKVKLSEMLDASEGEVVGKVLFVCRPPDKDSEF